MELKNFNKLFVFGLILIMVQGAFATSLSRSTVSSASAGSTITVTLNLAVTTNLISVAPIENIPEGWAVSDITGGFMHSEKQGPHRIEWVQLTTDPNVSLAAQSFSYKLYIPANASGTLNFDGSVIFSNKGSNSTTVAIGGTSSINVIGAATTTIGTTTTTLPVPAYAVRTISPTTVRPGASLTVHVNFVVNPTMMPTTVGIIETVPTGWTISDVSSKGLVLGVNQITWFFGTTVNNLTNPIASVDLTYTLKAPSTTGIGTFSGTVDYGTGTNVISGNNRVTIQKKSNNNDDFLVTLPALSYANSPVVITVANSDSKRIVAKAGVDVYAGSGNSGMKVAYGMTNENGTFTFTPTDAGTYTVYVDMSSYKEAKETLTVKSGAPTTAPTTTVVTTTQKVTTLPITTTQAPVTTTRKTTTTAPTTTQAVATTLPPETTTTLEEVTETTVPEGTGGGSNMLLIGIIVIIIIAAVVFFMMKGKKGKPAENGKKAKEEKAFKAEEKKE